MQHRICAPWRLPTGGDRHELNCRLARVDIEVLQPQTRRIGHGLPLFRLCIGDGASDGAAGAIT
jgi:hypothetical protein